MTSMSWDPEWKAIVAKLNASYPDQPINAATAREWYDDLKHLDAGDIWLAIRVIRREERFRPQLASILAGVKLHRRDMAEARQRQERELERSQYKPGVPMPPETREALDILAEVKRPDSDTDPAKA